MSHHQYSCLSRHIDLPGTARSGMRKSRSAARATAIICALATTACGGGGGGLGSSIAAGSPVMAGSSNPPSTGSSTGGSGTGGGTSGGSSDRVPNFSTGVTGMIGSPAPGSFDGAPLPTQIAIPGGPTFDGSSGSFPSNVSFPALSSTLQSTASGISAVSTNQSASVTVISTSASETTIQVNIPSVNLNITGSFRENIVSNFDAPTFGLSYVGLGAKGASEKKCARVQKLNLTPFGFETPQLTPPPRKAPPSVSGRHRFCLIGKEHQ